MSPRCLGWLLLSGFALPLSPAAAQPKRTAAADHLALQAREILVTHCVKCHGPSAESRAGLNVLSRKMLVEDRRVVRATRGASELLDVVAAGAMPPGTHRRLTTDEVETLGKWIDAGAPDPAASDDYVRRQIAADWAGPARQSGTARYLSLNHLLHAQSSRGRFDAAKKQLADAVAGAAKGGARLEPIDPLQSVFRVDLADLGWDARPFTEIEIKAGKEEEVGPSTLRVYDALLLEYPYGYLTAAADDLAAYLRKADDLRPVAYLRGDWLTAALAGSPLGPEVAALVGAKPRPRTARPADRVTLDEAAAELSWTKGTADIVKALAAHGVKGVEAAGGLPRKDWERLFLNLVHDLKLGAAVWPVDAVDQPELRSRAGFEATVEAVEFKEKVDAKKLAPKRRFKPKDLMALRVTSTLEAKGRLLSRDGQGRIGTMTHDIPLGTSAATNNDEGLEINADLGVEHLTLLAFKAPLPAARWLRVPAQPAVRDRWVHPALYRLGRDDKAGFETPPPDFVKTTTSFETVDPKRDLPRRSGSR